MAPVRTVEVCPPSQGGETRAVFRALALVGFGAFCVIGARWGRGGAGASELAAFQRLFRDAEPELQKGYRLLQEGLIEAENSRAATGEWPAPEELAAQGIAPFANVGANAGAGTRSVEYRWALARDGLVVVYHGIPAGPAPELLALIQEPVPGFSEIVDPRAPPDETHHRLPDGTVLHVSVWYRPPEQRPQGVTPRGGAVLQPLEEGFLQILVGNTTP